jgi:hypothetical protein
MRSYLDFEKPVAELEALAKNPITPGLHPERSYPDTATAIKPVRCATDAEEHCEDPHVLCP